jgi:hypothetical protein
MIGDPKTEQAMAMMNAVQAGVNIATSNLSSGGSFKDNMKDMAQDAVVAYGKQIAIEFAKNEIRERLSDEDRNMFIMMYETGGKYVFAGASNNLNKLDIEPIKGKKIKIGKMFFKDKTVFNKWISEKQAEVEERQKKGTRGV